ncbi:MAG TPA: site-specific DNA-methyltransferase [Alloacidobacterium sp.]|nr:site-specific DNA-methyltransferase [Alloacidobacterium sp.]
MMKDWRILQGDVLERLRELPDDSVHCVVTSPPYWRLRNYGVVGQIGVENTPHEYLEKMLSVFREIRRVLRKDGTAWVNIGDCYAGSGCGGGGSYESERRGWQQCVTRRVPHLKRKDLVGMPWRLAFALQADGWWLRQDIVWSKPNPMPLSVTDRCTTSHEYIFLLTKRPKYYFDAAAIRIRAAPSSVQRWQQDIDSQTGSLRANGGAKANGTMKAVGGRPTTECRDKQRGHSRRHAGFNERWDHMTHAEQRAFGANRRSVWEIATQGFSGMHFATFPEEIPRLCIMAGCPEGGTVLDPFSGAGTTGVVALRLGRKYVGIEINPEYVEMSKRRIENDAPLLNKISGD